MYTISNAHGHGHGSCPSINNGLSTYFDSDYLLHKGLLERYIIMLSLNGAPKRALYRIWCGVNRLGDIGVKVVV